MRRVLVCVAVLFVASAAVRAQHPSFEVASVKAVQMEPSMGRLSLTVAGGRLTAHVYTLLGLLQFAFNQPIDIVAPDWVRRPETRYEVEAVMPAGSSRAEARVMLQALLAERMGLRFHTEPRPMPAYDLVVDAQGPKLQAVDERDQLNDAYEIAKGAQAQDMGIAGDKRTIIGQSAPGAPVGMRYITARSNYQIVPAGQPIGARFTLEATRITMTDLASELRPRVGRVVIDRTGLTGVYPLTIDLPALNMRQLLERLGNEGITRINGDPLDSGFGPATVDLPKQLQTLGLKLVDRKEPLDVIVIDNINKTPTEN
jgi:uncharacterized protein (TIGR03435 family)